jgi:HAMP domain-containing protein
MAGRTLSWQIKLPVILVAFALVPMVINEYWALDLMRTTFEAATLDSLTGLATTKTQAIEQFTDDRRVDVERIAQMVAPDLGKLVAREPGEAPLHNKKLPALRDAEAIDAGASMPPVPSPAPEPSPPAPGDDPTQLERYKAHEAALSELRHVIGLLLWDQEQFEELFVLDRAGRVVASTFTAHEGRSAKDLAYFRNGLGATHLQPVFVSPITQRLTMVISAPIRDLKHQVIGVMAARLNLTSFFALIQETSGLGKEGETVVAKKVDKGVVFMAPTRHDANAALKRTIVLDSAVGTGLQQAALGQDGAGITTNYRGTCSYTAWRHVPSLDWGLAVHYDCNEAMAAVEQARVRMLLFSLGLGVVALLASVITAQTLVRPLRTLKEATDRISKGDVDVEIDIRKGDELGDLADSFERMVAAIRFFREQSRRKRSDEGGIADESSVGDEEHDGRG